MFAGSIASPFTGARSHEWKKELVLGNPKDEKKLFRWYTVSINLPGDNNYDPKLP